MSLIQDAMAAIRDTLVLSEKVQKVVSGIEQLTETVTDHEHRIIRLEAKWETAIELATVQNPRKLER